MLLRDIIPLVLATACTPQSSTGKPPILCEPGFLLDGSTCVPESCGVGRWGDLPVDDETVYVDATADEDGDGTEEAPYTTIQQGLDRAGSLVAVAAGTYAETLEFTADHSGVRLAGRCREMVNLDASVGGEESEGILVDTDLGSVEIAGLRMVDASNMGLRVESGSLVLREATISGSLSWGVVAHHSANLGLTGLTMEDCLVEGNTELGVLVTDPGTEVTLRETTVMDTQPKANGEGGWGIAVQYGATLSVEDCLVEENTGLGLVAAHSGSRVTVVDTTVRDTRPNESGANGWGLEVQSGAFLAASGLLIERNTGLGLYASDQGTEVGLRDVIVRDTIPGAPGEDGLGIGVAEEALLSAEGCLIEGNRAVGLVVADPGTRATLRETTIRGTLPDQKGLYGWGIDVQEGAALSADDCYIEANTEVGLSVRAPNTEVRLRDTTITDTRPDAAGEHGIGVGVQDGSILSADACLIDGNTSVGLIAVNPGTRVTLRDTTVRDTRPEASGEYGMGIGVEDGAVLSAKDCLVDGNTRQGLFLANPGTRVDLDDTTVRNTHPNASGANGGGIEVNDGALLAAEGCLIDGNTTIGVFAVSPGSHVVLANSTISATRLGSDTMASSASGLTVQDGGALSASQVTLLLNQGPGLVVNGEGATLDCVECSIEDNQFAGAVAIRGGALSISASTIQGTRPGVNLLGGAGVYAWPWGGAPPTVVLTNTLIQDNPVAGVWLIGEGSFALVGNTIAGGAGESFGSGFRCGDAIHALNGVTAWDGSTGLLLQDNAFRDASGSGVFLDASSALTSGNTYSGNAVDLVLQNQSCDTIPQDYAEAPRRDLCPLYNYPTCYAEFFYVALPADPVDWVLSE